MRRLVATVLLLAFSAMFLAGCETWVFCGFKKCTGTNGPDFMMGTDAADYKLFALNDCDLAFGMDGNDKVVAGNGDDLVAGNEGDDRLYGDNGDDVMMDASPIPTDDLEEFLYYIIGGGGPIGPGPLGGEGPPVGGGCLLNEAQLESLSEPGATVGPNDTPVEELNAQGGKDKFWGGSGRDLIIAADGEKDIIDCGPGNDEAIVDEGLDKVSNCEEINPEGGPPLP